METRFRIVIFSSLPPAKLEHLLRRLFADLPRVEVAGVLYEHPRPPLARSKRIKRAARLVGERDFRRFARHKFSATLSRKLSAQLDKTLRALHGAPAHPNGEPLTLERLASDCEARGISFHQTSDLHDAASLAFVRSLDAELGIVYGTRILKPELFTVPRGGSINIHKHKVPDYRGGGAPGIWELRDGQAEQFVTVHRVTAEVDAGHILGERSFPIDEFDTLTSVGLKADLVGIDLLVDVIRAESEGRSVETPQPAGGALYKGFKPHRIFAIEREISARRKRFAPEYSRPAYKLLARTLAYPALYWKNRRRRLEQSFPVVMLFHHVITDKRKRMGLPTEEFARHVEYLKRHYRVASLEEALTMLREGRVAQPTVVLTFDDGYAENFLCLRAVAEAENVPVALFVCTEKVSESAPFAHDLEGGEPGFPALDWEQVRYLDRHNVAIGSHTRTHFDCGSTDRDALASEIVGSKRDLCRELGHCVQIFAFPYGHPENMSAEALRVARENFEYVFSAHGGVNYAPVTPPCELRRRSHPDSLWELELTLQSLLDIND
ncbi:MAG TPA: polysaccharide deacetylase family protein [Pyrinomonadaceae bacterium]|nr:polysaccharide deacetylase family protein [Pyrinomonadaceae bacterium]